MSKEFNQELWLEDLQADLDWAISQRNWKKAREVIEMVKEQGYEHEARIMQASLRRATENDENSFVAKTGHLLNSDLIEKLKEETGWDPRDDADRNYP